jgi:hypothetical protein
MTPPIIRTHLPSCLPCLASSLLPRRRRRRRRKPTLKKLLLLPVAGLVLACASCSDFDPPPSPVPVTDTKPVGEGLKVIAYAMLGAAVVLVLGRMVR